jgi:hypothetical protein
MHLLGSDFDDVERDQSVIEQQEITGFHIAPKIVITDADPMDVSGRRIDTAIERERLTDLKIHGAFGETLDADLWPLQIAQYGDFTAQLGRNGAHRRSACAVIIGMAMRKIQAYDIDAFDEHTFEHARRIGGWAQRGDDPGTTQLLRHRVPPSKMAEAKLTQRDDANAVQCRSRRQRNSIDAAIIN